MRGLVLVAVITGVVYWITIYNNYERTETPEQFVTRVHDFYVDSGYDRKSLYQQDIELLQKYKQIALDKLTYKQTLDYIAIQNGKKQGLIDNDWINLIDETLKLADEWIKRVPVEEYLSIDSKTLIEKEKEPTPSELVFQNLLQ